MISPHRAILGNHTTKGITNANHLLAGYPLRTTCILSSDFLFVCGCGQVECTIVSADREMVLVCANGIIYLVVLSWIKWFIAEIVNSLVCDISAVVNG